MRSPQRLTADSLDHLVSADICRINAEIFSSPEVYALEREVIFKKCWQFVGCESQVPKSGDFVRSRLGEQDVLVVRDKSNEIHVLVNACRHRGSKLCSADRGATNRFRCGYHGWTYGLDGALRAVPMEQKLGWKIDKSNWGLLKAAQVDTFRGMIFATFDPDAEPLDDFLGDARFYMDTFLGRRRGDMIVIGGPHKWEVEANWKTCAENMTGDFYHVFDSHASVLSAYPGLSDAIKLMTDDANARFVTTSQGHAFNTFVLPEGLPTDTYLPIEPRWLEDPNVREYFVGIQAEAADRLGESQSRLRINTGTIFPNLSIQPTTFCLRMTLPKGPNRSECWCWIMGYEDMPDEVRQAAYAGYLDVFGPDGMLEPDDSENWSNVIEGLKGPMAAGMDLYSGMGMGSEIEDPTLPGRQAHPLSEAGQRSFYRRWRQQLESVIEE